MEESQKKLKFYDTWFWVWGISLFLFILCLIPFLIDPLLVGYKNIIFIILWIIPGIASIISLAVITFGMIYHEIKRKEWAWLIITLIALIIGIGAPIVSIIFYFAKMRNAFKRGEGIY